MVVKKDQKPYALVVDDDESNGNQTAEELKGSGYPVHVCRGGKELFRYLDSRPWTFKVALFVVKLTLSEMSGYEITRRLCEKYAKEKIPVIITSASKSPDEVGEAKMAGAAGFIQYPAKFDSIQNVLEQLEVQKLRSEIGTMVFDIGYS